MSLTPRSSRFIVSHSGTSLLIKSGPAIARNCSMGSVMVGLLEGELRRHLSGKLPSCFVPLPLSRLRPCEQGGLGDRGVYCEAKALTNSATGFPFRRRQSCEQGVAVGSDGHVVIEAYITALAGWLNAGGVDAVAGHVGVGEGAGGGHSFRSSSGWKM